MAPLARGALAILAQWRHSRRRLSTPSTSKRAKSIKDHRCHTEDSTTSHLHSCHVVCAAVRVIPEETSHEGRRAYIQGFVHDVAGGEVSEQNASDAQQNPISRECVQANPRAHIAAVHVPALLIQEGRMEAARVLTHERVQQQSGNIKLVSRLGTDLTGVKDTGPQAHWGPSCKQPSDHNFLEGNMKEWTPKSKNSLPEQCFKSQNHVVN